MTNDFDYILKFFSKVIVKGDDECWNWTANRCVKGYGRVRFNNHLDGAHRVSWIMHNGNILNKLHVLHTCDNRRCVNPNHLFLGTNNDNVLDKMKKGRHNRSNTFTCSVGHSYINNLYIKPDGSRVCIICRRVRDKKRYDKDKFFRNRRKRIRSYK